MLKIFIPFISIIIFFGFCEISIRTFNPIRIRHAPKIQRDISSKKIHELKKILSQSNAFKTYPELHNEDLDYSHKYVPPIFDSVSPGLMKENVISQSIVKSSITHKTIYDVTITTDNFGRRITPAPKSPDSDLILFGDSFTFGDGVNDSETFPFYLSKLRPTTRVINLGIPGLGLNDILHDLEFLKSKKYTDLGKRPTISAYTYMNDHLFRFFCGLYCYRDGWDWLVNKPQYDEQLNFQGTFRENKSIRTFVLKFFAKSRLLSYLGLNWPLWYTDEEYDLFIRGVLKLKTISQSRFNSKEFYFIFYPKESSLIHSKKLIFYLKKYQIKYLIYEDIDYNQVAARIESIPLDEHPTAAAHYLTAYLLDRDLVKLH